MVLGCGFFLWSCIQVLLGAAEHERVVAAVHLMAEVTATAIARDGRWPETEADLLSVGPITIGQYTWPTDQTEVEKRAHIDFGVLLAQVAAESTETFRAIRPVDANHDSVATRNALNRIRPATERVMRTSSP